MISKETCFIWSSREEKQILLLFDMKLMTFLYSVTSDIVLINLSP